MRPTKLSPPSPLDLPGESTAASGGGLPSSPPAGTSGDAIVDDTPLRPAGLPSLLGLEEGVSDDELVEAVQDAIYKSQRCYADAQRALARLDAIAALLRVETRAVVEAVREIVGERDHLRELARQVVAKTAATCELEAQVRGLKLELDAAAARADRLPDRVARGGRGDHGAGAAPGARVRPRRRERGGGLTVGGWIPTDAAGWPAIAEALSATGAAWPEAAAITDLRWWIDRAAYLAGLSGRRADDLTDADRAALRAGLPGRPTLARRWGWTDWAVRTLLRAEGRWWDASRWGVSDHRSTRRPWR